MTTELPDLDALLAAAGIADAKEFIAAQGITDDVLKFLLELRAAQFKFIPFAGFTDSQWSTIQAAREHWPTGIDWERARLKLTRAGRSFWVGRNNRQRQQVNSERERLEAYLKHTREFMAGFSSITPWDLLLVKSLMETEAALKICLDFCSRSLNHVKGRKDQHRERLYEQALSVWVDDLGGKLEYSPKGPIVRFMKAVLKPILGNKSPQPSTIRDAIRKEAERRAGR